MSSLTVFEFQEEEDDKELEEVEEETGMSNGPDSPDLRNFPCRRPPNANSKVYQFQRYLELTGVTKALSQALGSLCSEKPKPEDPMKFIVQKMCEAGRVGKWSEGVISLRNELSQLRTLVMYAESENERLRGFLKRSKQFDQEAEEEEEEFADEMEEAIPVPKTSKSRTSVQSRKSKPSVTSL